jgi:hypothetical protein
LGLSAQCGRQEGRLGVDVGPSSSIVCRMAFTIGSPPGTLRTALQAHAQLSAREASQRPPPLPRRWVWGFYDGVEQGVAGASDGSFYRFMSIGDSRSGRFRAFSLDEILLGDLLEAMPREPGVSWMEEERWLAAVTLPSVASFICIADPYLEYLVAEPIQTPLPGNADFSLVHSILRPKFRRKAP